MPPRSRNAAHSPSTSTTNAPADRDGRADGAPDRSGHDSAAPYGCAGSVAASTSTRARLSSSIGAVRAQPIDRARQRELRGAEPGDEPAPPGPPRLLERAQHRVHAREATARALGAHGFAGDDALAFEQLQRGRVGALGRRRLGLEQRHDERPPARARGRTEAGEPARMRAGPRPMRGAGRRAPRHPQRPERVVRDLARPHEIPERGEHDARRRRCRSPRRGRARSSRPARRSRSRIASWISPSGAPSTAGRRREQPHAVAEEQPDPTVVGAERARADPDELARRAQLVEHARPVAVDARGQHVAFEHRRRDRDALQLFERLDERVGAAPAPADALPRAQEPRVGRRVDRFDLVAQRGERAAAQDAQHVRVAPFAFDAAGPELAEHDATVGLEAGQRGAGALDRDVEARGELLDRERHVRARRSGRRRRRADVRPDR